MDYLPLLVTWPHREISTIRLCGLAENIGLFFMGEQKEKEKYFPNVKVKKRSRSKNLIWSSFSVSRIPDHFREKKARGKDVEKSLQFESDKNLS